MPAPLRQSLTIQIDNLRPKDALAIETMLAEWVRLGAAGASRWVCFYADGDGAFRPRIVVNGHAPEPLQDFWDRNSESPHRGECRIDSDGIKIP